LGNRVLEWSASNSVTNPFQGSILTGTSINDFGQFVGATYSAFSPIGGYYSDGTTRTSLGSFLPKSLSNNKFVAGSLAGLATYDNLNTLTGYTIGALPGDSRSDALGINPFGTQIVGVSQGGGGFLYDIATASLASLTSLLSPADSGWSVISANSINNQGQIAATATVAGVQHAVLLTVPEPSTAILSVIGMLALTPVGGRKRSKQRSPKFN
jgi:hypothetical protein